MLANNKILELVRVISCGSTFDETLDYIFNSFNDYIPYNRIGISLIDKFSDKIICKAVKSDRESVIKSGYSCLTGETTIMDVISSGKPRSIPDLREYIKHRPDSKSTKLLLQEGIISNVTVPLYVNDNPIGVAFFSSELPNAYQKKHTEFLEQIASYIALSLEKNILVNDLILVSITGLAKLVESKDSETGMHIDRIRNYCEVIAKTLSCNPKYRGILNDQLINEITDFAPIHDIGKVGIADGILLKPSKLSSEEFEVMKKHTIIGAEVLTKSGSYITRSGKNYFSTAIEIALGHHEKYNGKGYPYGLSGENIPLSAKIVTVADVFDALTSKRVYKAAYALEASFEIIESESGISFDPDVVEAFLKCKSKLLSIYDQYKEESPYFL